MRLIKSDRGRVGVLILVLGGGSEVVALGWRRRLMVELAAEHVTMLQPQHDLDGVKVAPGVGVTLEVGRRRQASGGAAAASGAGDGRKIREVVERTRFHLVKLVISALRKACYCCT